ncbi:hypothetical protein Tco_1476011 [Tanacetum coccineum]
MPTQTIPMLSKKLKAATADLHKDLLGTRNPGLGYIAKRAQPVLYDADTLLHPAHHPVRIWDSEDVLVHQVKELSHEQAYWLSANEIASNASNPGPPPVTPLFIIVHLQVKFCFIFNRLMLFFINLKAGGSSPSLGATIYASRFAANAHRALRRNGARKARILEKLPPLML